jgi:hypothetical protein
MVGITGSFLPFAFTKILQDGSGKAVSGKNRTNFILLPGLLI